MLLDRWLKRRCAFLWLLACGLVLTSTAKAQEAPACDELLVAGNSEYPPFLWRDPAEPDRVIGAVPAVLEDLFAELGIRVQVRHVGPWSRTLESARTGRIDLVAGAFLTDERQQYLDYVLPSLAPIPTVVWMPRGEVFDYRRWSDLKGRTGATLFGNSFGQAFDAYAEANLRIEGVRSIEQAFKMALMGRVDYVLYEALQGKVKLASKGELEDFQPSGLFVSVENLYIAFSKRSRCNTPELREAFADALVRMRGEGRVQEYIADFTQRYINNGTKP
ncbi:transporter substrate-binding domain-containing protein [Marinobacter sp. CA1]|nr:transporter substrate-binding domain-containing protein [Marinobacter sp. CA1]